MANELRTAFKSHYSNTHLISITNPDNAAATTVNDAFIDESVDDVTADFQIHAWTEFDVNNPTHIQVGIDGLYHHILQRHGASNDTTPRYEKYIEELRMLKRLVPKQHSIDKIDNTVISIVSGGTGYAVGNILTLTGGTWNINPWKIKVSTVSGGVITAIEKYARGVYVYYPTNPVSCTGGAGSGATFNISN